MTVAAQFVMQKQADESNEAWRKAYQRAVDETAKSVKKPGLRSTVETKGRRQNELYEQLLSAVKTSEMIRESMHKSTAEWKKAMQGIKLPSPGG
ncbi:MAG: hypothetical protein U1F68_10140 [Gammaproteobacteria bacterium]